MIKNFSLLSLLLSSMLFAQNLSYQEIQDIAKESADQFLNEYKNKEKMTLVVSNFINETSLNKDIFVRTLVREIRKSGQYDVINRAKDDSMIKDARAMRQDEEYDPYTTIEKGSLVAPDISLSGKITKTINNGEEIYLFLLTLTDIKTGLVIWDRDVILSKNLATSSTKITSSTPIQTQVQKPKIESRTQQENTENEQKRHSFLFFGFGGEVGVDTENNVLYSGNLKLGYTYKWNQSYAISFFGMYQFWNEFYTTTTTTTSSHSKIRGKSFYDKSSNDDEEDLKSHIVHGLGGGVELKLGYLYVGGGAIVELDSKSTYYLGEAGFSFSLGSSSNLNIGARYTYAESSESKHRFGGVLGFSFSI